VFQGRTVTRLRPATTTDPYSGKQSAPDWSRVTRLIIENAYVASSSAVQARDANRTQMLTAKSLYCAPGQDVRPLDRVEADGITYTVVAVPSADINPFTGWQPVQEIPLEEGRG